MDTGCGDYRSVDDRIKWFLSNDPGGIGWCARHTWRALGGDKGCPPKWGASNANEVVQKLREAGELRTNNLKDIPRGAVVVWEYGKNGHMSLSAGPERIATTDPWNNWGGTGYEHVTYPARFGAKNNGWPTGWSYYYAGITLTVGDEDMPLSDKDINKIAKATAREVGSFPSAEEIAKRFPSAEEIAKRVWKYTDEYIERNMQWIVRNTYRRLTGALDDLPTTIDEAVKDAHDEDDPSTPSPSE